MKCFQLLPLFFMVAMVPAYPMHTNKPKDKPGFMAALKFLFSKPRQQRFDAFTITLEDEYTRREGYQKISGK